MSELRELPGGAMVHESSYVDDGATIGAGTRIWHFCHVNAGAVIGERCSLGQNVVVMPRVRLGNNVKVQNNVSIYEGVECEDDVFLGPSMVFTNVTNPRSHVSRKHEYKATPVKRGASIGANATVVCGNTLGEYCFVGAGAVVTKDVPPFALVTGCAGAGDRLDVPVRGTTFASAKPGERSGAKCVECATEFVVSQGGIALATQ